MAGHQAPTRASLSLPSATGLGRESIMKGLWIEIRSSRDITHQIPSRAKHVQACTKHIHLPRSSYSPFLEPVPHVSVLSLMNDMVRSGHGV